MPSDEEVGGGPTVWASLGVTIATRPYENVKIDIGVSGIPIGCSEELLSTLLQGANVTLQHVVDSLAKEVGRRIENDFPDRA